MSTDLPAFPATHTDPLTLHETADDPDALATYIDTMRERLAVGELDAADELELRALLGGALRMAGWFEDALAVLDDAAVLAGRAGDPVRAHTALIRLAHAHQWRGDFATSNEMFDGLLADAPQYSDRVRAFTLQHAGENAYDQQRFSLAAVYFSAALQLRQQDGAPEDEVESSQRAWARSTACIEPEHYP